MGRTKVSRLAMIAVATIASALLMQAPALADTTLVDQTITQKLGGATVCVVTVCVPLQGVANLRVTVVLTEEGVTPPGVATGSAAGCTANVNVAVVLTSPGAQGTLVVTVSYDRTDQNGNIVPGSHETKSKEVSAPTVQAQNVPLASVCATLG